MDTTYVVVRGDTLSAIADKLGITLAALEASNTQLLSRSNKSGTLYGYDYIIPGDVLNVPVYVTADPTPAAPEPSSSGWLYGLLAAGAAWIGWKKLHH